MESQVKRRTIGNELANVPRMDIDGRRYGNTLTDDMIALKNPREEVRHTSESYDYLFSPSYDRDFAADNATYNAGQYELPLPVSTQGGTTYNVSPNNPNLNHGFLSRKKNAEDTVSIPDVGDHVSIYDGTPAEEILDLYHRALLERKALKDRENNEDIRADVRYLRSGGMTPHEAGEQWVRDEAEYDPAIGTVVNYNRLSPAQLEQLSKMGVNRPESEDLMGLIHLYQYYVDNLKGK